MSGSPWAAVYYAVARVDGVYQQLAVVRDTAAHEFVRASSTPRGGSSSTSSTSNHQGATAVRACLRAAQALGDPAHRIVIEGELALATHAFTHDVEENDH